MHYFWGMHTRAPARYNLRCAIPSIRSTSCSTPATLTIMFPSTFCCADQIPRCATGYQ